MRKKKKMLADQKQYAGTAELELTNTYSTFFGHTVMFRVQSLFIKH